MAFNTTPLTGIDLDTAGPVLPYAISENSDPTPLTGTVVKGDDGHDYILVESDGTHAASAPLDIDDDTLAVTAGGTSSVWEVPAALTAGVVDGDFFWARRIAL